jgi:D-3-phosphoglycerate dehydrogenase
MTAILISDPIAPKAIDWLRARADVTVKTGQSRAALLDGIGQYDALIVRSETRVDAEVLAAGARLRVVTRAGAGIDNIDVAAATERGIVVLNTPGANTISATEHTFGMLLALVRHIPRADAALRGGVWDRRGYMGTELRGKTLGILGLGRIGREVARRAQAFEMTVVAHDPFVPAAVAESLGLTVLPLDEVLATADVVTLHLPLSDEVEHLIGADRLARMKRGAFLVNCARGGLVDERALYEALASGHLGGAALDVFEREPATDSPLFTLPNVVVTPHIAASSHEAQENVGLAAAESTLAALRGELVDNAVNLPAVRAAGAYGETSLQETRAYVDLAQRLGRLLASLIERPAERLEIEHRGEPRGRNVDLISLAAIRGFLSLAAPENLTLVNARLVAQRHGLEVREGRSTRSSDFAGPVVALRAVCEGGSAHAVEGTVLEGEVRITAIDGYPMNVAPTGLMLVTSHRDRPGIIGAVGMLLGQRQINIAGMQVGRAAPGQEAVMVVMVDNPIPPDVLDEIKAVVGLRRARYVDFDALGTV